MLTEVVATCTYSSSSHPEDILGASSPVTLWHRFYVIMYIILNSILHVLYITSPAQLQQDTASGAAGHDAAPGIGAARRHT